MTSQPGTEGLEGLDDVARTVDRRFAEAIDRGDPLAASAAYAENARLLAPSADVIEGRRGIESFWRAGLDAGIRSVELAPLRIDTHAAVAFEIGHYVIRLRTPAGGAVVDRGTYLHVLEPAAGGGWLWSLETFTPEGSPQVAVGPRPRGQEVTTEH